MQFSPEARGYTPTGGLQSLFKQLESYGNLRSTNEKYTNRKS
jgi:hypothetical protein